MARGGNILDDSYKPKEENTKDFLIGIKCGLIIGAIIFFLILLIFEATKADVIGLSARATKIATAQKRIPNKTPAKKKTTTYLICDRKRKLYRIIGYVI